MAQEGGLARAEAAARVLSEAASIPLDQAGPVMTPPIGYWAILRQRIACYFERHAWGAPWSFKPLVPPEHHVARMLSEGAPWPTYEIRVCVGCMLHKRRRIA